MSAPKLADEPTIVVQVTLHGMPIGATPWGERDETFFNGTARSSLWEGEWLVRGIDHLRVSSRGVYEIDVHVFITNPDDPAEIVTYRGHGRAGEAGLFEGVTFETPIERLAWLNDTVAVGRGSLDGDQLTIELFPIER